MLPVAAPTPCLRPHTCQGKGMLGERERRKLRRVVGRQTPAQERGASSLRPRKQSSSRHPPSLRSKGEAGGRCAWWPAEHTRGSEGGFYLKKAAAEEVTPFPPLSLAGQDFLCSQLVLNESRGSVRTSEPCELRSHWLFLPHPPFSSQNTDSGFGGKRKGIKRKQASSM